MPAQAVARAPVRMGMESELGATGPLGYWDPLGMAEKQPEKFARDRAVELKHGRIAMAAATGYMVQEFLRWPGYLSPSAGVKFAELPNGIAAFRAIPPAGLLQVR
jgi:light-harvesting complex I chlorophyll a/b binding protein 1